MNAFNSYCIFVGFGKNVSFEIWPAFRNANEGKSWEFFMF